MHIKYRQTCRVCYNQHLTKVIDLGHQHFQGSFIKEGVTPPPTRKTPNVVVRCDTSKDENACGLIQALHTIPPRILYTNYWYESGISNTMRAHLKSIVDESVSIVCDDPEKKYSVLDIASNDNTLLRNYPKHFKKVGVDPCDIAARQKDEDIKVINDLFPTSALDGQTFDIITSIACFYDIEDPVEFAIQVERHLADGGIWVFEVAYWPTMLKNLAYDSIVNEHIIHYHLAPIEILLQQANLKVFDARLTDTNGGSILVFVSRRACQDCETPERKKRLAEIRLAEFNAALDEENTYENFRSRVASQKIELNQLIHSIVDKGETIHIYGASTKLNTILGYCGIGPHLIKYAAERSPAKIGGSTISGIKLISEEASRKLCPNYYLVGPYHFRKEILEREKKMIEAGTKFIFPLPKVEVYGG